MLTFAVLLQKKNGGDKMVQFHSVMTNIMQKVLSENNQALYQALTEEFAVDVAEKVKEEVTEEMSQKLSRAVSEQVSATVKMEVGEEVATKVCKEMNYVARMNDELSEERFRQLDELIRGSQKARQEAAASKGKKRFFGKRKRK